MIHEIKEMKLLQDDPFDFHENLSKIVEEGLKVRNRRENIKDYIRFTVFSITFLIMLITISLINFKIIIIVEIIISALIPFSAIPIIFYKVRRAKYED